MHLLVNALVASLKLYIERAMHLRRDSFFCFLMDKSSTALRGHSTLCDETDAVETIYLLTLRPASC